MYLVNIAIKRTPDAAFPVLAEDQAIAALRAEVAPDDGLEHISARAGPDVVHVGIFWLSHNRETAEMNALRLCRKALEHQPLLVGWQLADGIS
ncbi:hypothetical protein [Dactylosporangium sp. NPDC051541]|uniref:hypothetical protein n=1 Tax=Dactylosporangium sp. NPDC051541 TaxID=3363977 RepID=UPI0037A0D4F8